MAAIHTLFGTPSFSFQGSGEEMNGSAGKLLNSYGRYPQDVFACQ